MSHFKSYGPENPPKRGTGRKIWKAFTAVGITIWELHYNPNCWMQGLVNGWATWAGAFTVEGDYFESWCGWDEERGAYIQQPFGPYMHLWVRNLGKEKQGEDVTRDR